MSSCPLVSQSWWMHSPGLHGTSHLVGDRKSHTSASHTEILKQSKNNTLESRVFFTLSSLWGGKQALEAFIVKDGHHLANTTYPVYHLITGQFFLLKKWKQAMAGTNKTTILQGSYDLFWWMIPQSCRFFGVCFSGQILDTQEIWSANFGKHLFLGFSAWNVLQHHSPLLISSFWQARQPKPVKPRIWSSFCKHYPVELIHWQPMRLIYDIFPQSFRCQAVRSWRNRLRLWNLSFVRLTCAKPWGAWVRFGWRLEDAWRLLNKFAVPYYTICEMWVQVLSCQQKKKFLEMY